jgi:hypothetical protein
VSGALVTLAVAGSIPVRVLADGDGHYAFRDVPKGSFSLTASKPGYADGSFGRLRPNGPSQPLDMVDGQRVTEATVPLWKLGTIAGTVMDDSGEPVVNAPVRVFRKAIVAGKKQLTQEASDSTDDRGMYRIGSLVPGEYVVALPMTPTTSFDAILGAAGLADMLGAARGGGGGGAVAFSASYSVSGGGGPMTITTSSSGPGANLAPAGLTDDGHELWYQTVYYPNALSATRADIVKIEPGQEHVGIDFTIKAVRTVNLSGTLIGSDGPAASTLVSLVPAEADDLVTPIETASAFTDSMGRFAFKRVPTGQYALHAVKDPRGGGPAGDTQTIQMGGGGNMMVMRTVTSISGGAVPPLPTAQTMWIDMPVSVGTADVTDMQVTLRAGIRVSGRVEFNGSAQRPTTDQYPTIGISLDPADGRPNAAQARGRVEPSGTFTTMGVPNGKYVLRVNAPSGWVLRGAMANGHDISDTPVDLHDGDVDGVTIQFTDKPSSLAGTVTTPTGNPDGKAAVIVFPQDQSLWAQSGPSPRRIKNTRTGANGAYSMSLPAGDYYVVAISDAGASDWNDPQFLASLVPQATHLSIDEGDKHQQALKTFTPAAKTGGGR